MKKSLKQQAREEFMRVFRGHNFNAPTRLNLMDFNDTLIDTILAACIAKVPSEKFGASADDDAVGSEHRAHGFNSCRTLTLERIKELQNG